MKVSIPQLDVGTYGSQAFWLIVVFTTLYCFFRFFYMPRMRRILLSREEYVEQNVQESRRLDDMSDNIEEESVNQLSRAKTQASSIINTSIRESRAKEDQYKLNLSRTTKESLQDLQNDFLCSLQDQEENWVQFMISLTHAFYTQVTYQDPVHSDLTKRVVRSLYRKELEKRLKS